MTSRYDISCLLGTHNPYGKPREEITHQEFHSSLDVFEKLDCYYDDSLSRLPPPPPRLDPTVKLNKANFSLLPMDEFDLDVTPDLEKIGYQVTEEFTLPEEYMQEQPEVDGVEYDMDEQDAFFMDTISRNWPVEEVSSRKIRKTGESKIKALSIPTHEMFEYVVTLIERHWCSLASSMPPKPPTIHDKMDTLDDQACCICGESECDNSNAIVYCDGCDMACHQECYGVTHIPEGQWLCKRCSFSRARRKHKKGSCIFCPSEVGAFKMTNQKSWGHVVCALWIPEVRIGGRHMEPISHVRDIPRSRWKLHCYICKQRMGACIQCARGSCVQAFHVTCARRAGLKMEMAHGIQGAIADTNTLQAFCHNHGGDEGTLDRIKALRKWFVEHYDGKGHRIRNNTNPNMEAADSSDIYGSATATPSLLTDDGGSLFQTPQPPDTPAGFDEDVSTAEFPTPSEADVTSVTESYPTWKTPAGTPLLPRIIVDRICKELEPFRISRCRKFVTLVARYWALKREFKRGASLIKRLNIALENSQAEASTQLDSTEDRQKRYADTIATISELERIKVIVSVLCQREETKLEYVRLQGDILRTLLLPITALCLKLCDEISNEDTNGFFSEIPEIPGYRDVVACPMSLAEIRENVMDLKYFHVADMLPDINIMFDNAFVYNDSDAPVCVEATRLRGIAKGLIESYTKQEKQPEYQRCFSGAKVRAAQKRPFVAIS